jgi:hypothetical protein
MYATIHRFRRWPDEESHEWGRTLLPALLNGAEPAGWCVLGRLDSMDGAVFALWADEHTAAAVAARTGGAARWLDAGIYRVVDSQAGVAGDATPGVAQVVACNGAGDPDRADAAIRAGRERIAPAVRDVEGIVANYVLRAEDHSLVVLTLATGVETIDVLRRTVLTTELLPWEDPAQLAGPDRIDVHRVLVADLDVYALTEVRA